ncbi:unnamed protein product [Lactuca virosa]|uniref:Mitochondrial carrier protein n=1 Tax=Lactuca virosa TaxID=75947 RepID=A0AAU9MNR1_9ASTR|nr:unnamed protein product [Lactuca virosa]
MVKDETCEIKLPMIQGSATHLCKHAKLMKDNANSSWCFWGRRAFGPTLIGILPYAGLKFYIYEKLKRHIFEEHQRSIMMRLCCGALAGLFGQTFTYPLDVVRRQIRVENMQTFGGGSGARHKNTWQGITTIVSEQGWRQLFAGLSINYIKIVPSVSIGFTAYDMMKSWLRIPPRQKT